ncbi:MAG: glycosyltransferase [Anaerolineales bacterium]|nr:MAG: glycosyltransferase [Anaerolineales bacterium]
MRVLHVYKDYPPVMGGIEHHIQTLAEGLLAQGVDVHVLVTNTDRKTLKGEINGVPVTKTGRLLNISSAPISLSFCSEFKRLSRDADIVHLHVPYPPAELCQLAFHGGRHFVLTYHSDIVRQRVMGFFYFPFLRRVLRSSERIIVSNPKYIALSRFLRPWADKCRVIHLGIDLERFIPTPAVQQRAAAIRRRYNDVPLLLFVGRLRHYKGIEVLIDALKEVEAHALIVGEGPMGNIWKQKAVDEGVIERITFLGEVSEDDLVALYYAGDMFVLPSTNRAESWGIVQVEAMACGLPVICTELGTGTSYVNQHEVTGLVIEPNNSSALIEAIQRLIDDPDLRHRLGQAGQARANEAMSKEAMIGKMMALYAEITGL